jgi:uncharacterized membrane protein YeaQ/YmgE (transglycosylase-associated protein family)
MPFPIATEDLPHFFVLLAIAAIFGYVSVLVAGGRVPLGPVGSIGFGLLGAWLAADVLRPLVPLSLLSEPQIDGVTMISASLGALLLSLLWSLLAARLTRRRRL